MSWWGAVGEFLLLTFWLLVPGLALLWAMGVRHPVRFLVAPAISVGGLAAWAIAYGVVGIPWTKLTALVAVILTTTIAWVVRAVAARSIAARAGVANTAKWHGAGQGDLGDVAHQRTAAAALVGVVIGGLVAAIPIMRGMSAPDILPQAEDTVFHLNAVRHILDTGEASTFLLGRLNNLTASQAFYPSGWHGIVALGVTAGSVVVASNVMVVLVAALIFPAALAAVAFATSRGRPGVVLFAPIVGAGFVNFPAQLFSWGALWPNALAFAMVPAALACTVMAYRATSIGQRIQWGIATVVAVGGVALAQPNGLLVYGAVATPFIVWAAIRTAIRSGRALAGTRKRVGIAVPVVVAVGWCVIWFHLLERMNTQLRTLHRIWYIGFWNGAWQSLTDATPHTADQAPAILEMITFPGSLVIAFLSVAGGVVLLFRRESIWLIGSLGAVLVLAGLSHHATLFTWTDAWFSDIYRLRAIVLLMTALVVAHALDAATGGLGVIAERVRAGMSRETVRAAAALVVAVAFVAATSGLRFADREAVLRHRYVDLAVAGRGARATEPEQRMLQRLGDKLSDDGVVLGDPGNGSAFVSAVAGRRVVFPATTGIWTPDQRLVGERFAQIHEDPEVCAALHRLGVAYFYADPDVRPPLERGEPWFAGLPAEAPQPGFELVAEGGTARVYRINACG